MFMLDQGSWEWTPEDVGDFLLISGCVCSLVGIIPSAPLPCLLPLSLEYE